MSELLSKFFEAKQGTQASIDTSAGIDGFKPRRKAGNRFAEDAAFNRDMHIAALGHALFYMTSRDLCTVMCQRPNAQAFHWSAVVARDIFRRQVTNRRARNVESG